MFLLQMFEQKRDEPHKLSIFKTLHGVIDISQLRGKNTPMEAFNIFENELLLFKF